MVVLDDGKKRWGGPGVGVGEGARDGADERADTCADDGAEDGAGDCADRVEGWADPVQADTSATAIRSPMIRRISSLPVVALNLAPAAPRPVRDATWAAANARSAPGAQVQPADAPCAERRSRARRDHRPSRRGR